MRFFGTLVFSQLWTFLKYFLVIDISFNRFEAFSFFHFPPCIDCFSRVNYVFYLAVSTALRHVGRL